ncbi:hypothetical protein EBU91_02270 [bacterium]|nr:hypothetical protein [bacterium]
MSTNYFDLVDYYKTNFSLVKELKFTIEDIENMYFWEREVYVNLLISYNEEQKQIKMQYMAENNLNG